MNGNEIKIDVRAYPITSPTSKTVGTAGITINDMFAVKHIQIVDGANGLFARMPQFRAGDGQWKDICFPVSSDLRSRINEAVVGAYSEAVRERGGTSVTDAIKAGVPEGVNKTKAELAAAKSAQSKKTAVVID
jgi:stage V sporulation protein G